MKSHIRHIAVGQYWKIIEVTLNNAATGNSDFLIQSLRYRERDLHLDLSLHRERIHQEWAGVHRHINAFNFHVPGLADRHPRHYRTDGDFGAAGPPVVAN